MPRLARFLPLLLLALTLPTQAQISPTLTTPLKPLTQTQEKTLTARATNIIELANRGQYSRVRQQLSPSLAQGISETDIKNRWEQVTATTGTVEKILSSRVVSTVDVDLVFLEVQFAKLTDDIIVTFNRQGQILGVNFPDIVSIEAIAKRVTEAIDEENFAGVRTYFHPFLKTELYPQQLQERWNKLEQRLGQFQKVTNTLVKPNLSSDGVNIVILTLQFTQGTQEVFIIFDDQAQITGIDLVQ